MTEKVYKKFIETIDLNNTNNQFDLTDICRMLGIMATEYIFYFQMNMTVHRDRPHNELKNKFQYILKD